MLYSRLHPKLSQQLPWCQKKKVCLFRFLSKKDECATWLKAITFTNMELLQLSNYLHKYGKLRATRYNKTKRPSICLAIKRPSNCCIPKAPRLTDRTSFVIRNAQPDQFDEFRQSDQVSFNLIKLT